MLHTCYTCVTHVLHRGISERMALGSPVLARRCAAEPGAESNVAVVAPCSSEDAGAVLVISALCNVPPILPSTVV